MSTSKRKLSTSSFDGLNIKKQQQQRSYSIQWGKIPYIAQQLILTMIDKQDFPLFPLPTDLNIQLSNMNLHALALCTRWILKLTTCLQTYRPTPLFIEPDCAVQTGNQLSSYLINCHFAMTPPPFTVKTVLSSSDDLSHLSIEMHQHMKFVANFKCWNRVLPAVYERIPDYEYRTGVFAENAQYYRELIETGWSIVKWRKKGHVTSTNDIESRILKHLLNNDTFNSSTIINTIVMQRALKYQSLEMLVSTLSRFGIDGNQTSFVYLAYLIIVSHGIVGLSALLVVFLVVPRLKSLGDNLLYEILNLGFEHLGFTDKMCVRGNLFCGCKEIRKFLTTVNLFLQDHTVFDE